MSSTRKAHPPLRAFGAAVAACRRGRGLSQEALALETGIARSYLSGVERGVRNISLLNIVRLAKALNITVAKLMQGIDQG
ncbi:MAG: helix-turn-helix transcriptional regulator [Burkholderiales bacterium]|nr:helix-turn-helix transcriptional regulator [Burkholderiales bacterium]